MILSPSLKPRLPYWAWAIFGAITLIIVIGGGWFFETQTQHVQQTVENQLLSIAHSKVAEIAEWRQERIRDAEAFSENPLNRRIIDEFLSSRKPSDRQALIDAMKVTAAKFHYRNAFLVDTSPSLLLALQEQVLPNETLRSIDTALTEKRVVLSEIFRSSLDAVPQLDVVAPVLSEQGLPIAAMVMVIDPEHYLYPLINKWPVPSDSAETLVVRRDGNDALFVNNIRFNSNSALNLRIPLGRSEVPAVRAIFGTEGIFEGTDYRGVPVLAVTLPIPNSSWFMVAKVDGSEAYARRNLRAALILSLIVALLSCAVATMFVIGQSSWLRYYRDVLETRAALRESKEFFAATLFSIGDAVITTDAEGKVTLLNTIAERLTGWTSAEAEGHDLRTVFHIINAFSRKPVENPVAEVLKEGRIVGLANHTVLISRDGTEYQIADSAAPIRGDNRNVVIGVVLVFRDVTEEYQMQEQLKKSEELYRSLFQNASDAVFLHELLPDAPGRILDANDRTCDALGYSREELLSMTIADIDVPEQRARLARIMADLKAAHLAKFETEHLTKDGRRIPVEVSARILESQGKPHVMAIVRDISERKQAEASLAAEKERLAVTLRSIGDAVISTDVHGHVVLMNRVAEQLTGWKLDEALGKQLEEVFSTINEQTRRPCENPVDLVLKTGGIITLEDDTLLVARDGREICVIDSGAPIKDMRSETVGVVLVFRDITDKRKAEEEMIRGQKLSSLAVMAGGIAHDFNNLLGGILGHIDVAREYAQVSDMQKVIRHLSQALTVFDRARSLSEQLLTFSRGGIPVKKTGDVGKTLRDTAQFALTGSNIRCEFVIASKLWPCDYDANQIAQVIDNLVINAKHAMPHGGVIEVTAENVSVPERKVPALQSGKYICFAIKDHGIGIPKEYLSKVFDPFFTTKETGSGLGLATSHSIVRQHGGYIEVESQSGAGSVFTVYLPASKATATSEESPMLPYEKRIGRILVMDDEEYIRDVSVAVLKSFGHTVMCAANGDETIALYTKAKDGGEPFSVVILDLTIPGGIGGKETVKRLLEIDPNVRAIASSGYSEDPVMAKPRQFGFRASLKKPYKRQEMEEVIAKVLADD